MNIDYLITNTSVSRICCHFVFCPRYRRKIFRIPGVEDRFKELTASHCASIGINVIAMECHDDHAHVFVQIPAKMSAADAAHKIKGATSIALRREFEILSRMPSLWTRSYFVSTAGDVSAETIKRYVETQKYKP